MNTQQDRLTWLWLLIGFLLLPFVMAQTVIPIAAWLAPIFLLRFGRTSKRARIALVLIFLAYAVGILIATRGGWPTDPAVFAIAVIQFPVARGLLYTLPYAADHHIGSRLGAWPRLFVFPAAYTTVEWIMSLSRAINSTGSLAYSQYANLALMQVLSITGMWGLTFLITWCAPVVNLLWEHGFDWRPVRRMVGVYGGVLLAVLLFGNVRLNVATPASQTVQAATITIDQAVQQEATSQIVDWLSFNQSTDAQRAAVRPQLETTVNQMLERTETALRGGAKIVSWAEGAGTVLEEDKAQTLGRVGALAKQYDAYIDVSLAVLTRTTSQTFIRNQSILVDPAGSVLWTYDKAYPVIPVESYYTVAGVGRLPVVDTPYGRMSTAICNDLHFLPLIRQAGAQRVDILLAPYSDLHPWESEDAVTATYRAVENGFSLVRPTDMGYSTIVDYQGRVLASQDTFTNTSGIMMTTVPVRGVRTVYSLIGDGFAYLCVAGLVFLAGLAFIRRKQPAPVPAVANQ